MTTDIEAGLDRLRTNIERSNLLVDADREALLAFSDRLDLLQSEYGDQRHEKLLRHCTIMAGHSEQIGPADLPDVNLTAALEDEDARDALLAWINDRYDNPESNRDYRIALRMFGRHVTDGDEVPDILEEVPSTTSRNGPPMPDPGEMLDWHDDVLPMVEATRNNRDAALIAVAWDSGARSGELRALTVGDITDHTHGLQITVDGKTGQRSVTLIPSVPYLNRWLADHPASEDTDAPLWSKLTTPEAPSYQQLRKSLNEAAERAGVTKPTTFTNFRKSSAAYLASQGLNQAHIEQHHGWRHGSRVASRYIRVFDADADSQLAAAHGADVEGADKPDPIAPVTCPRCGKENPRDEPACVFCGQAIEPGAAERVEKNEREVRNAALAFASDHPELVEDIDDLERLMQMFDSETDLAADADRIAATIDG